MGFVIGVATEIIGSVSDGTLGMAGGDVLLVVSNPRRIVSTYLAGHGVVCQRWRDRYGQVELKATSHYAKHMEEEVRLLDDVYMVRVSHR